jgi:hypothetical protein
MTLDFSLKTMRVIKHSTILFKCRKKISVNSTGPSVKIVFRDNSEKRYPQIRGIYSQHTCFTRAAGGFSDRKQMSPEGNVEHQV